MRTKLAKNKTMDTLQNKLVAIVKDNTFYSLDH